MNEITASSPALEQPASARLQQNLIAALTRLKHTATTQDFLGESAKAENNTQTFFGFGIGAHQFLVESTCFCEVFVDAPMAAIPNSPGCVVGLFNVRGSLIPVYQIHTSLDEKIPKKKQILVVGKGESAVGLLIDSLPVSLSIAVASGTDMPEAPFAIFAQLAQAYFTHNTIPRWLLSGKDLPAHLLALAHQFLKTESQMAATSKYLPV